MSEPRDLRDLIGDDVSGAELERLKRVHELLVRAGAPPELSPVLKAAPSAGLHEPRREGRFSFLPRRRLGTAFALAGGLVALAFGAGYLTGHRGFDADRTIDMRGTSEAPSASASIAIGSPDKAGNVPMLVRVHGLPELKGRGGHYDLYLTSRRKPILRCGTFRVEKGSTTTLRLNIPYPVKGKRYGWVVTRELPKAPRPGPVVLTTF